MRCKIRPTLYFALALYFITGDFSFAAEVEQPVKSEVDLYLQANPAGILLQGFLYTALPREEALKGEKVVPALEAGLGAASSPAYGKLALKGIWRPAPFFLLVAQYDLLYFYGQYGGTLSFGSGGAPFGDRVIKERKGEEESGLAHHLSLAPTFYARVGRILLRNQTELSLYRFPGRGPYFHELEYDTLVTNRDYLLANRFNVMAEAENFLKGILYVGPGYEYVRAHDARLTRQRVYGQAYWEAAAPAKTFGIPHFMVQAGVNIEDRNREKEGFALIGVGTQY